VQKTPSPFVYLPRSVTTTASKASPEVSNYHCCLACHRWTVQCSTSRWSDHTDSQSPTVLGGPMSHYRISPQKSILPAAARGGRIFTGKLSAGRDFSGRRYYDGETFYKPGNILVKRRHVKSVILFLGGFFMGATF